MTAYFVPFSEIVDDRIAWFWEAVEVGQVPWLFADDRGFTFGQYDADPEETPFILCPDDDERAKWAVCLLTGARDLPAEG